MVLHEESNKMATKSHCSLIKQAIVSITMSVSQ